jgi:diguanylate cyclase (GGDEF)-like protein/PAS domain S-box-containing protein
MTPWRQALPTIGVFVAVFALACALGYLGVRQAVLKTVEHQALAVAEVVAKQATTARSVYAREIAAKLTRDGFGPSVDSAQRPGHVPIPAQFLKLVGKAASEDTDPLFEYRPVSQWNLEPGQGLSDDFLRWAWPQLAAQDQAAPTAALKWKPVSRFEDQDGRRVLRYLTADPASQPGCVACHNAYEKRADVMALRTAAGVDAGKQFVQHQLMGALSITIPLHTAEQLAGTQVNQTTLFMVAILIASFSAMFWFNWRLIKQQRNLRQKEVQLARSELEAQSARALLVARQGVESAFAELSSYMTAIDQHAIVSVADAKGRITQVNDMMTAISGYSRDELIGQNHRVLGSGTHDRAFFKAMWSVLARGEIWRGVICNRNKAGALYWVDAAIVPLKDTSGRVVRYLSIRMDISERIRAEQDIKHLATHDSLTGLVNRELLRDRIRQALRSGQRTDTRAAVLFIDLDQFKTVNDSLGHATGDRLLIEVARRMQASVRAEDTVARQGGDEFIVFMPRIADPQDAATLADKLVRELARPFIIDERELFIGSSVGIAVYPDDGQDVDTLLKNSDMAMYQVKDAGRNHYLFFAPSMNEQAHERYALGTELRRAQERNELLLHYQPIVCIESGAMVGMEALLRWQHAERGLVPPAAFVPLAEAAGLIVPIGEWVIDTVCRQIVAWRAAGWRVPKVAVNLSAIQVQHKNIVARLAAILGEHGVEPAALELEITEGSLMRCTDEVVSTLEQLADMGFSLAIDDFGTGYSSLSYLRKLPIDTLKIDRSFVNDITDEHTDSAIVVAIIAMARSMRLEVIAEGVETVSQREFLRSQGCTRYQGYLAHRPQAASAIEALLPPATAAPAGVTKP